jgi:4-hydroxy-tetrahydrodipicolinate synthase
VRGVHSVLVTPLTADESVDAGSIRTLVDFYVASGVDGVLALGVLGEADRLSDSERRDVLELVVAAAAGRVTVTVGISHPATRTTVERAREAESLGAEAVMVSPTAASRDHFLAVRDAVSVPLVVQDYPASSGVTLPVDFLASLGDVVVKLEDPPTPRKVAALRAAAPSIAILGGLGGVSLLHELEAGADGTMTGFAVPEALVEIVQAYAAEDLTRARRAYESALPLMVFEAQPGAGAALRKEILLRRGAIASATVRSPAPALDPFTLSALDALLEGALA